VLVVFRTIWPRSNRGIQANSDPKTKPILCGIHQILSLFIIHLRCHLGAGATHLSGTEATISAPAVWSQMAIVILIDAIAEGGG
jgi:hypothetical protein